MTETATCAHHWLIDAPGGPTSEGRCKNCGETREFPNAAPWYGKEYMKRTLNPLGKGSRDPDDEDMA